MCISGMSYNIDSMTTLFIILTIITTIMLLIVSAFRPERSHLNVFELERLANSGDKNAKKALAREKRIPDIYSLQRVMSAVLEVLLVVFSEQAFGLAVGITVALILALEYGAISKLKYVKKISNNIYQKCEKSILRFIKNNQPVMKFLRSAPMEENSTSVKFSSVEELQHLIAESEGVLSSDEKKLIVSSLEFNNRLVSDVMVRRDQISSISKDEFLGPLALNDLHKLGYSRLPVVDGDIDHIIGILNLKNMLTLDEKQSSTAERAMDKKVYFIHEKQNLDQALAAFMKTHYPLLIVVNDACETVGLVSLEDVVESLVGKRLAERANVHTNASIAARNSH